MDPSSLSEALRSDLTIAQEHDVEFSVVSRTAGSGPGPGQPPPDRHGTFADPSEAISVARSLSGRDATVVADGHGPYWHSADPDTVNSVLLRVVCRDKRLGPEEARLEHEREYWRDAAERLRADQQLADATDVARTCETFDEAERLLQESPLSLSKDQAKHLLTNRNLRLLTAEGTRHLSIELDNAARSLGDLGPSLDEPDQ